jgi:hypothetical protein
VTLSLDDFGIQDTIFPVRAIGRPRRNLLSEVLRDDGARQFRDALIGIAEARDGFSCRSATKFLSAGSLSTISSIHQRA